MRKFRLVKEYPGSGNLGDVAKLYENHHYVVPHQKYRDGLAIPKDQVENQPEYWEEVVEDIYYMVSLIDMGFHNAWEPMRVETIRYDTDTKKYFSTKEGAKSFILLHKPCLSMHDILERYGYAREFGKNNITFCGSEETLKELVKSRI